jgi:Spy/CpxP family protein refolding chaperone
MLLAGALSLALGTAALAQQGGPRAQTVPVAWQSRLNLTDDQKAKLKAAGDAYRAELATNANLTTPREKRQANRKARQTYDAAVAGILNPDQQKTLSALKDEAKVYNDMGAPGNSMAVMGLTDDQKAKVKAISEKYSPEITKLRADLKGASDKKPIQDQIRAAQDKMLDEIKTVLTPEQLKQLPKPRKQ